MNMDGRDDKGLPQPEPPANDAPGFYQQGPAGARGTAAARPPKLSPTEGSSHHTTGHQLLGQLLLDAAMDNLRTRFILSIPFMVLGFLLTRSPFMMTSVAPAKPWADGPMQLITTPQFLTKKVIV